MIDRSRVQALKIISASEARKIKTVTANIRESINQANATNDLLEYSTLKMQKQKLIARSTHILIPMLFRAS